MQVFGAIRLAVLLASTRGLLATELIESVSHRPHHRHRHQKRHQPRSVDATSTAKAAMVSSPAGSATPALTAADAADAANWKVAPESGVVNKMQLLGRKLDLGVSQPAPASAVPSTAPPPTGLVAGTLDVNSPLPSDFSELFSQAVSAATGCQPSEVNVVATRPLDAAGDISELNFQAPLDVVNSVRDQAADPDSKLATGPLRVFLMEKDEGASESATDSPKTGDEETQPLGGLPVPPAVLPASSSHSQQPAAPAGLDVDMSMPYGDLEAFGREDTAQELTENSVQESNAMVDQLERAEVAEEKRSVFRALTRLRGAAIASFDGVARSQTGNIDEYNKLHKWRLAHPIRHLAEEESDVSKWAFPDGADF